MTKLICWQTVGGPKIDQTIDSIDSLDSTDSIVSIDFIGSTDSIDSILVPHKRPPTFTPHTEETTDSTDGGQAPIGSIICPLCVV